MKKEEIIQIKKENIIGAYKATDNKGKELLSNLFKDVKLDQDLIDQIDNFDQLLDHLGLNKSAWYKKYENLTRKQLGFIKVELIIETFCEGWKADFSKFQNKYYLWFKYNSSGWSIGVDDFYGGDYFVMPAGFYFPSRGLALKVGNKFLTEFNEYLG